MPRLHPGDQSPHVLPVISQAIRFNHQNSVFRRDIERENSKIKRKVQELKTNHGCYALDENSLHKVELLRGRMATQHNTRRRLAQERIDQENYALFTHLARTKPRYL